MACCYGKRFKTSSTSRTLSLTAANAVCEAARSVADTVSPEQAENAKNDKTPEFKIPSTCPQCGDPFPFCIDNFDVIDVLRCPNCDALFERGRFVCYGAKSEQANSR